jgi:P27 family predicted phage terminase small subunit
MLFLSATNWGSVPGVPKTLTVFGSDRRAVKIYVMPFHHHFLGDIKMPHSATGRVKPGRRPQAQAVPSVREVPAAPTHLSERARNEWNRLVPAAISIGTFTDADHRAMELLCDTLAAIEELTAAVRDEGYILGTGAGGRKGNPLLRAISEQRSQAMKLLGSFGLTPLGRMSVDVKPEPLEDNPFAALRRRTNMG